MTQWDKQWNDAVAKRSVLHISTEPTPQPTKAERKAEVRARKDAERRAKVLPYVVIAYAVIAVGVASLVVSGDYWQAAFCGLLVVVFSHYASKKA